MKQPPMPRDEMRRSRDPAGKGEVSDPPEQLSGGNVFADDHKQLIERSGFFFLATTDAEGWPECAYHGGLPGFVRIVDGNTLAFPYYDGEVTFRSLDNIRVNSKAGLLFIDLEQPRRLRMVGTASIHEEDRLLEAFSQFRDRILPCYSRAARPCCACRLSFGQFSAHPFRARS